MLFDATGSFASTWIVCLACSVVMLVFLLASEPIAAKLRLERGRGVDVRHSFYLPVLSVAALEAE